MSPEM